MTLTSLPVNHFLTLFTAIRKSIEDPKLSAPEVLTAAGVVGVRIRTVQQHLVERDLHGRVPAKIPYVSKKNTGEKRKIAKEHLLRMTEDWRKVFWTDESKFNLCEFKFKFNSIQKLTERLLQQ